MDANMHTAVRLTVHVAQHPHVFEKTFDFRDDAHFCETFPTTFRRLHNQHGEKSTAQWRSRVKTIITRDRQLIRAEQYIGRLFAPAALPEAHFNSLFLACDSYLNHMTEYRDIDRVEKEVLAKFFSTKKITEGAVAQIKSTMDDMVLEVK